MLTLVIFVAFAASTFLCVMFVTRSGPDEAALKKRVRAIQPAETGTSKATRQTSFVATQANRNQNKLYAHVSRLEITRSFRKLLVQSGSSASYLHVLRWSVASALVLGLTILLVSHLVIAGCAGFLVGSFAPLIALRWMRTKRIERFGAALPDAIDLLSRSLRAGHSLASALEIVGDQAVQPLAEEFQLVARQQRLGAMFRDTLLELAERVPSQDLHFLITAMLVQRENGGDLTQILERTAKVISERLRIAGEVRTYSAQGRLTGWLLSALPVVLLVLVNIASPGYSKLLFSDPLGRIMLVGATISIAAGIVTIRKIVDIKV